ncbi:MAG: ribonuclease J [Candidatus Obscuribacterales bacterium]|nr:ribonuclease J [Candidatus Obscuribacterales bacterium]
MTNNNSTDLKYDRLSIVPLGGQGELGQVLWMVSYAGEILLIDAGAAYPSEDMPGVDLLLPNTNFLEANQERIKALLLTNGHEEHSGGVSYLLQHLNIPRLMGPKFVTTLVSQGLKNTHDTVIDTIEMNHPYEIGSFEVEWIRVNDAIADACALRIGTPEGNIIYTSSFKLDQTPVDNRLLDFNQLAKIGDQGVLLLISDSSGVETTGYTPSEKVVGPNLEKHIANAKGRVVVVLPGTNTHRLQILFDLAQKLNRKVVLYGDILLQTAVVAVITGNLTYDRKIESSLEDIKKLKDDEVLIVATGPEGDAFKIIHDLANDKCGDFHLKSGDTVIYSSDVTPGRSRQMAMVLDQFLAKGIHAVQGTRQNVHVSAHPAQEDLKFMLSITKPQLFVPALGEGRHIMQHAQLAIDFGIPAESVFPLQNGDILEIKNGNAQVENTIEATGVLYNRDQGEKVTSFSVKERLVLSLEGVVTIGLAIGTNRELLSGPTIEANGSGFLCSDTWKKVKKDLHKAVLDAHTFWIKTKDPDMSSLRSQVREVANKTIRGQLQSKPVVQVLVHELATN